MRFRAYAMGALALLALGMAGCAAGRHREQTDEWSLASATGTQNQYGLSVNPYNQDSDGRNRHSLSGRFDFSHPRVDNFVNKYQTYLRGFYSRALARSGRYVKPMRAILERQGLPHELAYLPLIESGYSTRAVSRAGAAGPWQFIPGTGRRYGLRIDNYVDERRDPMKSTEAAARYLRDLHEMFGDWHLSLAAYNTGEGNIQRVLSRSDADDFWEMSERGYLYRETTDYVPGFLAALQIAENPEAFGFERPRETPQDSYDTVHVGRFLKLTTVARFSGTSVEEIQDLNPALHRGVIPPSGYVVRLPKGTKDAFEVAVADYEEPIPVVRAKRIRRGSKAIRVKGDRAPSRGGRSAVVATRSTAPAIGKAAKGRAPAKATVVATRASRNDTRTTIASANKRGGAQVVASASKRGSKASRRRS